MALAMHEWDEKADAVMRRLCCWGFWVELVKYLKKGRFDWDGRQLFTTFAVVLNRKIHIIC